MLSTICHSERSEEPAFRFSLFAFRFSLFAFRFSLFAFRFSLFFSANLRADLRDLCVRIFLSSSFTSSLLTPQNKNDNGCGTQD
jgi:hypothetical protein